MSETLSTQPSGQPSAHAGVETAPTTIVGAAAGLAIRAMRNLTRLPSAFIPSVAMPLFQAIAFSGTFFAIIQIPGFPTDRSINWFLPLAVLMGCGFAGIGAGFAAIRDIESGFYDRLRMSPAPRGSLVLGPVFASLFRATIVITVVLLVGLAFGARPPHPAAGIPALYFAGWGVAWLGTGWGLGLAYRFRDMRAAAIMQLTFFLGIFLTDAQTPLSIMEGWLEGVARINPFTNVLRLARLGFLDPGVSWDRTWGGVVAVVLMAAASTWFAISGLRRLSDS